MCVKADELTSECSAGNGEGKKYMLKYRSADWKQRAKKENNLADQTSNNKK